MCLSNPFATALCGVTQVIGYGVGLVGRNRKAQKNKNSKPKYSETIIENLKAENSCKAENYFLL